MEARPATQLYRLRKFIRRNKAGVLAASAIVAALMLGLALAMIGFVQARRQAARADREAQAALTQAVRSEQVSEFLTDMLQGVGPSVALGRDTTMLREILNKTSERLNDLQDQPAVGAELRKTLGNVYVDLGDYAPAVSMHREALALRKKLLGDEHPEVADSLNDLGRAYYGEGKYSDAEGLHRKALSMRRQLFGEKHPDIATSLYSLAQSLRRQGPQMYAEAEELFRDALAMRRELLGNEHLDVAASLGGLGAVFRNYTNLPKAKLQSARGSPYGGRCSAMKIQTWRHHWMHLARCSTGKANTSSQKPYIAKHWQCDGSCWETSTPTWRTPLAISPRLFNPRENSPRPSPCFNRHWPCGGNCSETTIPTW